MDEIVGKGKASRALLRNLAAGIFGFVVALILVAVTLLDQDFLPAWYVRLVLFAVPLPVAGGLAVGLISPRKAIAWAPLWSAILAIMLLAGLSGMIHGVGSALSPIGIACTFLGAAISACCGLLGQWAVQKRYVGKSVLALVIITLLLGGVGCLLFRNGAQAFQRSNIQQLALEIDRDYISLSVNTGWTCRARVSEGCYEVTCRRAGRPFGFYALADGSDVDHINYEVQAGGVALKDTEAARAYLRKLGIREPILEGLSRVKGISGWQSVLKGTRLILSKNGHMSMGAIPPPTTIDRSGGVDR